ncbi:MAG: 2-hydroxychromene-2-carboxylate isomerase [Bacteriovoracaceae bacterium]|nr:2-hydroxychromene-2-carboxylate isomerase [Bacteriovoracaceae bacterium]
MQSIPFYFDYLSPFSYFAWMRREEIPAKLELLPVALGPVLNHWGIKGPGEVQPKREFLLKQCIREAKKTSLPFTTPKTHPFNSLYALRLSLKEVAGPLQERVIDTLWKAGWQKRIDMGEPDELIAALRAADLPAEELYEKSFTPEAKKALKANIARATASGVFGVPSFVATEELFWGADSIPQLKLYLEGHDNLDRELFKSLLDGTPRAASQGLNF